VNSENCLVSVDILPFEVVEHTTATTYDLEKTPSRMVIELVSLEVLGQVRNPLAQQTNLNLRGSSVCFVSAGLVNEGLLGAGCERHEIYPNESKIW
jgi:hypothetical protein